jgi:hypothetical protein
MPHLYRYKPYAELDVDGQPIASADWSGYLPTLVSEGAR